MWLQFVVLLIVFSVCSAQNGYYNVIGPRIIRPNSEYHAAISVHATSGPTSITATLQGQSSAGSPLLMQYKEVVPPYSSVICRFEVGDIKNGDYKLHVSGTKGLEFEADFPLDFVEKSYSVFIQTDRSVYQPGSTIMFRVIALNPALKPAAEVRNELLNIHIQDGKGNKVKEWKNIEATKGVFSNEIKLSDSPVLGNWNISVNIHGQTYNKSIEVAEYILPKFIIDINVPKHLTFRERTLPVAIDTRYSYGKKVKGEATITVYPTIYSGVIQPIFQNPIRKVVKVEGTTRVDFEIENDLALNDEYERTVIVDVTIEESPTGRRQNNSAEVHIHKYKYKMDLVKTADYFKPGLRYTAYVKVSNHDGTPLRDDERDVVIRHGYSRTDEVYEERTHRLDKNGILKLDYITPTDVTNTTALRIEAEYKDLKERISPIPAAVSYGNIFLQVNLETEKPIVNLDVDVVVNCTEPMKYINYVLFARGDVLLTNTFQVDNEKVFRFRFTAVHAMVPVSHLIVYYIKEDGELVGDVVDVVVDGLFDNFINVDINTDETEPELDVELTVRARQNSYIGLMAVDENVMALRQGYDITPRDVADELQKYDIALRSPYSLITQSSKIPFVWKPGSSNPHSAIYEAGADLLTNARINRHKPTLEDIYLRPVFYGSSTVKPDRGFGVPLHSVTRPPLAGPYAFSRIPKPVWNKPKVYLTKAIAPTWLFTNFSSGYEGKSSIRRKLPSTLTNWLISGFSLDPIRGLALMNQPKKLKVAKSFVVTLDLPYSVQKGEILAVPVVIYNYMPQDIVADVTLHNTEQNFEFAEISNDVNFTKKIELYRRKKISISKNSGASVSFMITPLIAGSIEIKVTANTPRSQDIAIQYLQVELGGETEYYSKSVLIDMRQTSNFKRSINFTIPKNAIEESEKVEVSTVGNLLGAAMIHLENLIRLPTGCGEQNLVHVMPNIIILQYLKNIQQLTPTIQNEALSYLEQSYQKELTSKRSDGSFSPFGERDSSGNVWLTAYVVLSLKQAKQFIYVDDQIITTALEWLAKQQGTNGSFVEIGTIIHDDLQNKNGNSLALTAFTLMAFMESQRSYSTNYTNTIYKGLDYITRNMDESESTYTVSICSYVLYLAKHTSRQSVFNLLDSKAKVKDDMKWWAKDVPNNERKNPWTKLPRSLDIEMTSYAILTFMEANLLDDAMPALNWLVNQQNNLGGFTSSRDTVLGLQALYRMVLRLSAPVNLQLEFSYNKGKTGKFSINQNTAMILQSTEIDKQSNEVNITAKGSGIGIFKVSYQYNMNVTGPWPLFTLDPQVDKNSNVDHLQLSICTAFVSRNLSRTALSNMAVMEVTLPSGFTADRDSLPSLEVSQNVQRVETSHGDTKVILYFNNLTVFEYCPTVSAYRTHKVAKQRPVPVVIYDYYDTSRRARVFYWGPRSTLCDICEAEDCGDICSAKFRAQTSSESENKKDGGASGALLPNQSPMLFIFLISLCITLIPKYLLK
ncbi:thioester-containing protein 3 isoform X1 [Rhynchophorus ferrugineus]|uniref:thioester-containing protein 3 isoform X1 n=2 Tax=Rhynchophorus ferrugineus TaxID=354439 RepID=UPI003FCC5E22